MNLLGIERLQNLLRRVEQNAKLPRQRTQGFSAEPPLEDVSLEDLSGVELEAEEPQPASPPITASATPYPAPPSLDEFTFSEAPPPDLPAPAEIEAPPVSAAHAVSEPPDSIDAALLAASEARASAGDASESEVPLATPPPESGLQVTIPPLAAPALPAGIDAADVPYRDITPTVEQLGDVIELDQASGPPLELAEPPEPKPQQADTGTLPEELEFVPRTPELSRSTEAPSTGEVLARDTPPPPARFVVPAAEVPPDSEAEALKPTLTMPAASEPATFGDEATTAASVLAPEVIARSPIAASRHIVDVIAAARAYRPESFLELLDASMGLLKK